MGLYEMNRALKREICAKRNQECFEEAKGHQREFREYETVRSMLAVLGDRSMPPRYAEKEPLLRALLREQKRRPHPLWNAILVVVFYPMLTALRGRVFDDVIPGDDLDQIVLSSFFDAVHRFTLSRCRDRIFMRLRQMTQREAFKRVRAEQRALERMLIDTPEDLAQKQQALESIGRLANWPETEPTEQRPRDAQEGVELVSFLLDHAGYVLDGDKLELVLATLVRGERLTSYVDRVYPSLSPSDRCRTYQRIKRRHSRGIARLREALADLRGPMFEGPRNRVSPIRPVHALPMCGDRTFAAWRSPSSPHWRTNGNDECMGPS